MTGRTEEVEKALYVRQFGVPFEALGYVFGRDPLYWYRAWLSCGRVSLVGATVKREENLPLHLTADEKLSWLNGERVFSPRQSPGAAFSGASLVTEASTEQLIKGYGEFLAEARQLVPTYQPQSVCTDGWKATRQAWQKLCPTLTLIRCFLHSVLKLKERCRFSNFYFTREAELESGLTEYGKFNPERKIGSSPVDSENRICPKGHTGTDLTLGNFDRVQNTVQLILTFFVAITRTAEMEPDVL
jgi:hypothetical protein